MEGTLKAGAKLNEHALSQQLQVSRSALREAVRRLQQSGLVTTIPNRGMFVRRRSGPLPRAERRLLPRPVQLRRQRSIGGIYDHALMQRYIGYGTRFVLSGSDLAFLVAGAQARTGFLRGRGVVA